MEDCLRHHYAWDWQVDARDVYLARLVRDLGMPVGPIVARLHAAEPELGDTEFTVSLGVLGCLGKAGIEEAVDGVRDYIVRGPGWQEALEEVAGQWPVAWWDDLLPQVRHRLRDDLVFGEPWTHWARRDPGIPLQRRATPPPGHSPSSAALLATLRDPARRRLHRPALRELARRPAEPELLEIVGTMDTTGLGGAIARALVPLGRAAVPAAQRWAAVDGPPRGAAIPILAAFGDASDVPVLLAEIACLDGTPDHLCGYDDLVTALARIGGPATAVLPAILRRIWLTPHSYERASYLRACRIADPPAAESLLVEGLWDCEEGVRRLAVEHVALSAEVRERLAYLRDDPIEDPRGARRRGRTAGRLRRWFPTW
ncbi:hypothetical protein DMB66_54525 [Actinoplanes sp. ATCC 53533]|nr:hypothetical protein DMB66_54525 [Actinoplanes sp. ATCC 53533]